MIAAFGKRVRIVAHEEGDQLIIESPYEKDIESFNNDDSFPDLSFIVVSPTNMTLKVHKRILVRGSDLLKCMMKKCVDGKFQWKLEGDKSVDMKALVKALKFCYGEALSIGTKDGECCAMISVLHQLQFKYLIEMVDRIKVFALSQARKSVSIGIELLKSSTRYVHCSYSNSLQLNRDLAIVVFSKKNIHEHYKEVVDGCLLDLPIQYFDMVEYGEPQSMYSEFSLKMKYIREHHIPLLDKDKQALFHKFDLSKLTTQELRELRKENIMSAEKWQQECERAMEWWEGALKEHEEETKKTTDKAVQAQKEIEELKKRLDEAGRQIEIEKKKATQAEIEKGKLEERIEQLEKQVKEEKHRTKRAEKEKEKEKQRADKATLEKERIWKLQKQPDGVQEWLNALKKENDELQEKVSQLEKKLKKEQKTREQAESEMQKQKQQAESKAKEVVEMKKTRDFNKERAERALVSNEALLEQLNEIEKKQKETCKQHHSIQNSTPFSFFMVVFPQC